MREVPVPNPFDVLDKKEFIKKSLLEIPSGIFRLKTSIDQRNNIDLIEAERWLFAAQSIVLGVSNEVFLNEADAPILKRRLSAGFTSVSYVFETQAGDWVIKIGAEKSPIIGYFDPSDENYAHWYYNNLYILRAVFANQLPHIIPKPQEVMYANNGQRSTTLIIQPFIEHLLDFEEVAQLSNDEQRSLAGELDLFDSLCRLMQEKFDLSPDLLGSAGNLKIVQKEDGPHLILLDNGLVDGKAPSPIHRFLNRIYYKYRISHERRWLRR